MTCTGCGTSNAPDAAFCAKCGTGLRAPAFCSRCATPVASDTEFCTKCGKRVADVDPPRLTPAVMPPPPMGVPPMQMQRMGCPRCGAPFSSHTTTVAIVICIVLFPIGLLALTMPKENRCVNPQCRWRW